MTVRVLIIEIDDEQPLGPQLAAAREYGKLPWKLLRSLAGGKSVRHLQNLVASAHFCERRAVRFSRTLRPHELALAPVETGEDHVMTASTACTP